jgi:hypothetical protein
MAVTDTTPLDEPNTDTNSPETAEQLNSLGDELTCKGNQTAALSCYQEAMSILDYKRSNSLLYDFEIKSKEYAVDMAVTMRKIGNLLREKNELVGAAGKYCKCYLILSIYNFCTGVPTHSLRFSFLHAIPIAEVYKECLDLFLEGLVDNGGIIKRKLLECEYKKASDNYQPLDQVDRKRIGRILCLHPVFPLLIQDISQLFNEMSVVKFVGLNAASSKRRRRKRFNSAMEENLKHAVESLTMSSDTDEKSPNKKRKSSESENETWMNNFWEKEMGRFKRPRPLTSSVSLSGVISPTEHYKELSNAIVPAEDILHIALNRFPLPDSVLGGPKAYQKPVDPQKSNGGSFDSDVSPRSVSYIFVEDNINLKPPPTY